MGSESAIAGFLLVFLLPFHLGGGAALGVALRGIYKEGFKLSSIAENGFFLVWGSMFGGLPLVFGLTMGSAWFFLLEVAVFLGAIVLVAVRYEWLRDLYSQPGMFVASFGFVFFLIGAALATTMLSGGATDAWPIGLIFAGVGGIITLIGVFMLLRVR
jgi:hypothetical protein